MHVLTRRLLWFHLRVLVSFKMRVAVIFTTLAASSVAVTASPLSLDLKALLGIDLDRGNHYGAPIPPWNHGANPGWYFGSHPDRHPRLTCLSGVSHLFFFTIVKELVLTCLVASLFARS